MIITSLFEEEKPALRGERRAPVAVGVGCHDPTGATGLGANLRTWVAQCVHPMSVVTCVEARHTGTVKGRLQLPLAAVQRQMEVLGEDVALDALKVGFVGDKAMIQGVGEVVERLLEESRGGLVVDPEFVNKRGERRGSDAELTAVREHLMASADVIVVNCYEAELLVGHRVGSRRSIGDALKRICDFGGGLAVVHSPPGEGHAISFADDGTGLVEFGADRLERAHLSGSGAVFSAAVAGALAKGARAMEAVEVAKALTARAVSADVAIGSGERPIDVLGALYDGARLTLNSVLVEEEG